MTARAATILFDAPEDLNDPTIAEALMFELGVDDTETRIHVRTLSQAEDEFLRRHVAWNDGQEGSPT